MRVIDLGTASEKELKQVCPAVYVIENVSRRHDDMFGYGVVGIRGDNSSLHARFHNHEKDWSEKREADGRQLYRHAVSPFKRHWAVDLTGWTKKAAGLAEDLLRTTFAKHYTLKSESCFLGVNDVEKLNELLRHIEIDLQAFERLHNDQWRIERVSQALGTEQRTEAENVEDREQFAAAD